MIVLQMACMVYTVDGVVFTELPQENFIRRFSTLPNSDARYNFAQSCVNGINNRITIVQNETTEYERELEYNENRDVLMQCIRSCREELIELEQELKDYVFYLSSVPKREEFLRPEIRVERVARDEYESDGSYEDDEEFIEDEPDEPEEPKIQSHGKRENYLDEDDNY
jgi:hypothetical protein